MKKNKVQDFFKNPLSQIVIFAIIMVVLQLLSMAGLIPNSFMYALGNTMIYAIAAIGFCLLLGYSGLSDALLKKYITDSAPLWEGGVDTLRCTSIGSVVGTHAGPGAVAAAFFHK